MAAANCPIVTGANRTGRPDARAISSAASPKRSSRGPVSS
jgi:hypothetical protein